MSQRRVVRVISYEGIDSWVAMMLRQGIVPPIRGRLPRPAGTKRE
jgi:hypothetical protein